ncbi:MAG: glycosyltransferase family 2 protein [Deltaproteobacteria bacterium]|nr:glycosyltransferase family 2 protein [Deltaproteobacteria bacterium]
MSDGNPARYVIVSPVRDEAENIEATIESVIGQTLLPAEWIIVNDGSSDRTGEIVERAIADYPWIHVVHQPDRGYRAAGSGVMEAFYAGYESITRTDWDFLVKLDGDLHFESDYFEHCLKNFDAEPGLGIGGGVIYNMINGVEVLERHPRFHVRGATKIYRRECWEAIGGLVKQPGWDTLDEVHAHELGWVTRSFYDNRLVQLRYTGDAAGQWKNWVKNGRACYVVGYHPLFILARAFMRLFKRPFLVASVGILWGFVHAAMTGAEKIAPPNVVRYLREQQLRRLVGMSSIWK